MEEEEGRLGLDNNYLEEQKVWELLKPMRPDKIAPQTLVNAKTGKKKKKPPQTKFPTAENKRAHLSDHYVVTTYLPLIWK